MVWKILIGICLLGFECWIAHREFRLWKEKGDFLKELRLKTLKIN